MSKIVRVEVGRFDYALVGDFKFFKGGKRPSVLVRLTDEDGVQGWGQSVPVETWTYETVESVESTLTRYLAAPILGADPSDLADIHARMDRAIRPSFSMGQPLAKAAIDLGNRGQTTFSERERRKRGLSPISNARIDPWLSYSAA
jgi:L-alanine-DL-glutamate epimerase-like enolase superfamily enzyme